MYTILKPSVWKSRREVRDASNVLVASYEATNWWGTKADADVRGEKYSFSYTGWDARYSHMTDASGQSIASMEPKNWWGMRYRLLYRGKEYEWMLNGWGTRFTILDGTRRVMQVRPGGYFRSGEVSLDGSMGEKEAILLVLFGIYQTDAINAQAAAGASGGSAT